MRMMGMAMHVIRTDGFFALYNGLSASLCRQVSAWSSCCTWRAALCQGHRCSFPSHPDDIFLDSLWHL